MLGLGLTKHNTSIANTASIDRVQKARIARENESWILHNFKIAPPLVTVTTTWCRGCHVLLALNEL